ncbi:MAG: UDP-glucose 4-epimerase, partial [Thermoleophilia bacterium]
AAVAGVARLVFASSSSVYGEAERYPTSEDAPLRPLSPYGVTKLACEHLLSAYAAGSGLDWVCLRYFTAFGPR